MSMKIIICGPAFTDEMGMCMKQAPVPASRAIRNLLKEFKMNGYQAESISFIANRVTDKRIYGLIESAEIEHGGQFIVKSKFVIRSVMRFRWELMQRAGRGDIVLFYNVVYPYYGLPARLKKIHAVPVLIFADYTEAEFEKKLRQKLFALLAKKEFLNFDSVVSLADFNQKLFKKTVSPLVLRGGIEYRVFEHIKEPESGKIIRIMYAGMLSEVTGADQFLEAVHLMGNVKGVEYYISGRGPLEDKVRYAAKRNPKVHYAGFIREEKYYSFLEKMHILVNPRNMELDENHNNFPSKILDYLASGRVIVSTKFSGWKDFEGCIEWYAGSAPELAAALGQAIEKYNETAASTYKANREEAKKYDWSVRAGKILEYINGSV